MRAFLFVFACGLFTTIACGPKRPPRIEGPPPEYEVPDEYDAGADSAADDDG